MGNLPIRICGTVLLATAIMAAAPEQKPKSSPGIRNPEVPQPRVVRKNAQNEPRAPRSGTATTGPITDAGSAPIRSGEEPLPLPEPPRDRESSPVTTDRPAQTFDSGTWATNPFVVTPLALVLLIALGLHFVHISTESKIKQQLTAVRRDLQRVSATTGGLASANFSAGTSLTDAVDRHGRTLSSLYSKVEDLNHRVEADHSAIEQAFAAAIVTAEWIGNSRLREFSLENSRKRGEDQRKKALITIYRYKEVFAENANRVRDAAEALDLLIAILNRHRFPISDFVAGVEILREEIQQVKRWESEVNKRLQSLECDVFPDDSIFRSRKDQIAEQLRSGAISVAVYVQEYRDLIEEHFSNDTVPDYRTTDPSEHEQYLRDQLARITDHLMDWFDRLYQLHGRIKSAADSSIDAEIRIEFSRAQKIAKEMLARFDIQPHEIEIGLASFDRRLHDVALVMQASDLPANTIVGVQHCGFRRLSTGDVLRRPKVVVSGNGGGPSRSNL